MYVCNCNGITEKQVDVARKNGADSWPAVYAYYNCEPKCGKCIPDVCQRLNITNKTSPMIFGNPELVDI